MLGGLLSLIAAATFAASNVSVRRGVITGSVLQALAVTVPIGIPFFLAVALAAGTLGAIGEFSPRSALYLSLAGIVHFVLGRYCNFRAIQAMGANLAGPVQQTSLIFALGLAVWLLGEVLTPLRILGIALVVVGPAMLLRTQGAAARRPAQSETPRFEPRYAEGYVFGALSALCYGISPVLVRAGLVGADPGTSLAGGLLSYLAATVVVAVVLLPPKTRRHAVAIDRGNIGWFVVSGVLVCLSQMVRYMALSVAPVAVVASIQRTSIVFRILFSWMINREHEVFGIGIAGGIVVSLLGAVALTVDTDFVISLLALPDDLSAIARWQWPRP